MGTAVIQHAPMAESVVLARTDFQRYIGRLLESSAREKREVEQRLASAKTRLESAETETQTSDRGVELAEKLGLPDQVWRQRADKTREVKGLRRRVLLLTRQLDELTRFQAAIEAGHVPIPRLPALQLDYARQTIPVEALESMDVARETGLFDEFRIVDGRDADRYGTPRRGSTAIANRDPILVGMVGGEMFPLAWWR